MSRNKGKRKPATNHIPRETTTPVVQEVVTKEPSWKHPTKLLFGAILWSLASIGGLGKIFDYLNDVPKFHITPAAMWLAVGNDIRGSRLAHEVTLVMPCVISNSGKRKLNPIDYALSVKLKDGTRAKLRGVRTPKDVFGAMRSMLELKDAFKNLNDLTQDTNSIDIDSARYGYICFRGKDVTYEKVDELTALEADVLCIGPGETTYKCPIVLNNNFNDSGHPRYNNMSIQVNKDRFGIVLDFY